MRAEFSPARVQAGEVMQITLSPKWAAYVRKQLKANKYRSASEVLQSALRGMQESDAELQSMKREIAEGIAQADRGELIPVTEELIQGIMSRGRARLAARNARKRKSA
jgi:putative addiction module CopG family antidote